jgi:hypothetical protein
MLIISVLSMPEAMIVTRRPLFSPVFTLQERGCVTVLTPVFQAQLTKGKLVTFPDEFQLRCDAQQFAR